MGICEKIICYLLCMQQAPGFWRNDGRARSARLLRTARPSGKGFMENFTHEMIVRQMQEIICKNRKQESEGAREQEINELENVRESSRGGGVLTAQNALDRTRSSGGLSFCSRRKAVA